MQLGTDDKAIIYAAISEDLSSDNFKHSVSDIIGGITKNECVGSWKHPTKYWKNSVNNVSVEAFAHFFEATARNDNEKLRIIKAIFPTAYQEFISML